MRPSLMDLPSDAAISPVCKATMCGGTATRVSLTIALSGSCVSMPRDWASTDNACGSGVWPPMTGASTTKLTTTAARQERGVISQLSLSVTQAAAPDGVGREGTAASSGAAVWRQRCPQEPVRSWSARAALPMRPTPPMPRAKGAAPAMLTASANAVSRCAVRPCHRSIGPSSPPWSSILVACRGHPRCAYHTPNRRAANRYGHGPPAAHADADGDADGDALDAVPLDRPRHRHRPLIPATDRWI